MKLTDTFTKSSRGGYFSAFEHRFFFLTVLLSSPAEQIYSLDIMLFKLLFVGKRR